MKETIVVQGVLADDRHIELDEPLVGIKGKVEVAIHSVESSSDDAEDIFSFISSLPSGRRTKEDIDTQVREERENWGDR